MLFLNVLISLITLIINPVSIVFFFVFALEIVLTITAISFILAKDKESKAYRISSKGAKINGIITLILAVFIALGMTFLPYRPLYIDREIDHGSITNLCKITNYSEENFVELISRLGTIKKKESGVTYINYREHDIKFDYIVEESAESAKKAYENKLDDLYDWTMNCYLPEEEQLSRAEKEKHVVTYSNDGVKLFCSPIVIERAIYFCEGDKSVMTFVMKYNNAIVSFTDRARFAMNIKLPDLLEDIAELLSDNCTGDKIVTGVNL